jgi:hypothetical protein
MQSGNRVKALQETVHNIAKFANKLEPLGLSIRFLNFDQDEDGEFDNLNDLDDIDRKVTMVNSNGRCTRLGVELHQKVIRHIVIKAKTNVLKKPVIVSVITDGEVSHAESLTVFYKRSGSFLYSAIFIPSQRLVAHRRTSRDSRRCYLRLQNGACSSRDGRSISGIPLVPSRGQPNGRELLQENRRRREVEEDGLLLSREY